MKPVIQNSEFRIQNWCVAGTRLVAAIAMLVVASSIAIAAEATLLDAAERGDRTAALQLLAKGANPNAPGLDGTTAIMWAASNDDLDLVRSEFLRKSGTQLAEGDRADVGGGCDGGPGYFRRRRARRV